MVLKFSNSDEGPLHIDDRPLYPSPASGAGTKFDSRRNQTHAGQQEETLVRKGQGARSLFWGPRFGPAELSGRQPSALWEYEKIESFPPPTVGGVEEFSSCHEILRLPPSARSSPKNNLLSADPHSGGSCSIPRSALLPDPF